MEPLFIASAQRTPIGSFLGALSHTPAPKLGSICIEKLLEQLNFSPEDVQECIMGQVLTAGTGQAPCRQAVLGARLPARVDCTTINKVCGSGLKAVMLAADSLRLGHAEVVVAGGQENMSLAPHLLLKGRGAWRLGPKELTDSILKDGLIDPYEHFHMGSAAESCAQKFQLSREKQDSFAAESYKRAQKAQKEGLFEKEISPINITDSKAKLFIEEDEEPPKARFEKMSQLKPAFEKEGTITAANASKINDGAAALLLVNKVWQKKLKSPPMARIVAYTHFAQEPKWFTTAPIGAIQKVLQMAGKTVKDIDLWEINEAFSVVTLACMEELKIPHAQVNIHGGAVALGHPIGASGARILTTLLYALEHYKLKTGLATLCIGGGEAVAMVVERP